MTHQQMRTVFKGQGAASSILTLAAVYMHALFRDCKPFLHVVSAGNVDAQLVIICVGVQAL